MPTQWYTCSKSDSRRGWNWWFMLGFPGMLCAHFSLIYCSDHSGWESSTTSPQRELNTLLDEKEGQQHLWFLIWLLHKGQTDLLLVHPGGKYVKPAGYKQLWFHLSDLNKSEGEARNIHSAQSEATVSQALSPVKGLYMMPSCSSSPIKGHFSAPSQASGLVKALWPALKSHTSPFLPSDLDSNGNGTELLPCKCFSLTFFTWHIEHILMIYKVPPSPSVSLTPHLTALAPVPVTVSMMSSMASAPPRAKYGKICYISYLVPIMRVLSYQRMGYLHFSGSLYACQWQWGPIPAIHHSTLVHIPATYSNLMASILETFSPSSRLMSMLMTLNNLTCHVGLVLEWSTSGDSKIT